MAVGDRGKSPNTTGTQPRKRADALSGYADTAGLPDQDRNNLIYVPLWTAMLRLEDNYSAFRDEIDGIYLQLEQSSDSLAGAELIRGVLNASHRNTPDFNVIVPAALLA